MKENYLFMLYVCNFWIKWEFSSSSALCFLYFLRDMRNWNLLSIYLVRTEAQFVMQFFFHLESCCCCCLLRWIDLLDFKHIIPPILIHQTLNFIQLECKGEKKVSLRYIWRAFECKISRLLLSLSWGFTLLQENFVCWKWTIDTK